MVDGGHQKEPAFVRSGLDGFELIGRGGNGTVYRALDTALNRRVAVKVLARRVRSVSRDDELRPPREALAQAALSDHPNVVTLLEWGADADGEVFIISEYAAGGSLADRVSNVRPLGPESWFRLGFELCSALAAAHTAGIRHCDVKPSNVLFAADGGVRLADFGLARGVAAMTSETLGDLVGSLAFMPPEMFDGAKPSTANDVYSAALTMWFAATGCVPFDSDDATTASVIHRIQSVPVDMGALPDWVGVDLAALLAQAVSKVPGSRPRASELREAFAAAAGHPTVAVGPAVARRGRRRWMVVGAVAVAALVASTLAAAKWEGSRRAAADKPDVCESLRTSTRQRNDMLNAVAASLEQATSPASVFARLLVDYPQRQAKMFSVFITEVAASQGVTAAGITERQLADLTVAEAVRALQGGKPFLFDGQSGAFTPSGLPPELREPARVVSDSLATATEQCPEVTVDFTASKARMNSAILSNLENPQFIDQLFDDPGSHRLFDQPSLLILASLARPYLEAILDGHWDWLFAMLRDRPELRNAVAFDHPDLLLVAVTRQPELLAELSTAAWKDDLASGISRANPTTRFGIKALYGPQLALLGIEVEQ